MAAEDDFGTCSDEGVEGGEGFADAGFVRDDHGAIFFFEGDIEIDADEDAFSGEVEVTNGFLGHKAWERSGVVGNAGAGRIPREFRKSKRFAGGSRGVSGWLEPHLSAGSGARAALAIDP